MAARYLLLVNARPPLTWITCTVSLQTYSSRVMLKITSELKSALDKQEDFYFIVEP